MKMKVIVVAITLFLLLSGMMAAVGDKPIDGEEVDGGVDSESRSAGLADSAWPSFGRNRQNTGRSPYNTSHVDGTVKWSFSTGWDINSSPTIGENHTIYIGGDENLYALYPNGTEKWSAKTGGNIVSSSPAVSSSGMIYVGSFDHHLYAFYPNGTEKWSFDAGHSIYSSPAIWRDGTIYVGSADGHLYAVNPNGTEKWSFRTDGFINSSPAIDPNGTIYIGSWDNNLYAVHPNGTEKWRFSTGNEVHSSPSIASDGTIYVGSEDNKTYAVYPNGTEKWNFSTGNNVQSSPSIGGDGTIYVGSKDDNLYALNPENGTEKWNFSTGGPVHSSPAIGSEGTIYFGSYGEKLYALDPDGSEKWNFSVGYPVVSPAIGSDGRIYVGSHDDNVYAIGEEEDNHTLRIEEPTGNGTVEVDGKEVTEWPYEGQYEKGTEVGVKAVSDDHWYFVQWTGDHAGDEKEINITMDSDKQLTAVFEERRYLLNVEISGEGIVEISPDKDEYEPNEEVELTAVPDENWRFVEWERDGNGTDETIDITMDSYKEVTAVFEEIVEYNLTINVEGEGTTDPAEGNHTYEEGTEVSVEAVPAEGWKFVEWTGNIVGKDPVINVTMIADQSITAVFEEVEYDLTISVDGEGTTDPAEGTHTYEEGTEVTVESTASEGWKFIEWTGDVTEIEPSINVTMDGNKNVTAVFEEETVEYDLTINMEGEGTTDPSEGTHTYEEGTEVRVEATASEGWEFVEWTGDETGTEPSISITMAADKSVTGVFEEVVEYDLKINVEGKGTVEVDPDQEVYEEGAEVTLTAESEEGWSFDEWTGDAAGDETTINITMDSDKEVTTNFEEKDDGGGGIPGFTSTLMLVAGITAVAIYYKKRR